MASEISYEIDLVVTSEIKDFSSKDLSLIYLLTFNSLELVFKVKDLCYNKEINPNDDKSKAYLKFIK